MGKMAKDTAHVKSAEIVGDIAGVEENATDQKARKNEE
jgi:hypothetical protein